ncbi:hypothetical protein diail_11541 [Diaporthe ilicicola]|nr:hypothetical protein diail_11541 [Diaporthe ilicicola]
MASHPAKRPRTDAGPSSGTQGEPSLEVVTTVAIQPLSAAESRAAPEQVLQPLSVPEDMPMPLHEALEYLDPYDKTPHDLYCILAYSAAAHPDVAQMMDRFARLHRDTVLGERDQNERRAAMGLEALFVPPPTRPQPQPRRPGRPHGPVRPKEVIEPDKAAKAAKKAERESQKAARKEARLKKQAEAVRRKTEIHVQDKDFTSMVSRVEEELGCIDNSGPKRHWSRDKKRQHRHDKAVEVEAKVTWIQGQILQRMIDCEHWDGSSGGEIMHVVTFGTKKNALAAMMDIMKAVLSDTGHIGAHLRKTWFTGNLNEFKTAVHYLTPEELAMLINDWKWMMKMRSLIGTVRAQGLKAEVLEEILLSIDPEAMAGADPSHEEDGDEESQEADSSDGSEKSSEAEFEGAYVHEQFRAEIDSEQSDGLGLEGSEESPEESSGIS